MIKELIYILILILGIPTGLLLSRLCRDEIKKWKKRMIIISITSLVFAGIIAFTKLTYKIPMIITLIFIAITNSTILWKSNKKKSKKK